MGYAYVVLFRKRPAYRYTVKHSIYVHHEHLGRGIGRLLLQELIDACAAAGFRQMIGYIDADNAASLALHEKFGFSQGRAACPASPIDTAAGPTASWCSARSASPRRRRRRRSPRCADPLALRGKVCPEPSLQLLIHITLQACARACGAGTS